MGSCALLPLALWKQLCVLNTGITWYFKSLYAHPSKMVLEDYREFHEFIVKSIPRFMLFGQRNLNLIEKNGSNEDRHILCRCRRGFFFSPLLSEKWNRYFWYEDEYSFTGKWQMFRNFKSRLWYYIEVPECLESGGIIFASFKFLNLRFINYTEKHIIFYFILHN